MIIYLFIFLYFMPVNNICYIYNSDRDSCYSLDVHCLGIYEITFGKEKYKKDSVNIKQIFYEHDGKYFLYLDFIKDVAFVYSKNERIENRLGISKMSYKKNYADSAYNKILERFKHKPIEDLSDSFYKSGLFLCLKQNNLWIIDINQCPNYYLTRKIKYYIETENCFEKAVWIPCGGGEYFNLKK